jgi:release factor glutamine methyltransferase
MMEKDIEWLLNEKYGGKKTAGFLADVKRLENGEPLSYVIGYVPFLDTKIFLDSKPLIPRPETEFWVEKAIKEMENKPGSLKVLDLCAGSGCVGVAVLKHVPGALVDFVEIDKSHFPTIKNNVGSNKIDSSRTKIIESDMFEKIEGVYDFILSNPPYIDPQIDRTENSVKRFEPHSALYGGDRGLTFIEKIIRNGPSFLTKDGEIWLEHEPEQKEQINQLATLEHLSCSSFPDQFGIIRYTVLSNTLK